MAPTPPPKRVGGTVATPRWAKVREAALKAKDAEAGRDMAGLEKNMQAFSGVMDVTDPLQRRMGQAISPRWDVQQVYRDMFFTDSRVAAFEENGELLRPAASSAPASLVHLVSDSVITSVPCSEAERRFCCGCHRS